MQVNKGILLGGVLGIGAMGLYCYFYRPCPGTSRMEQFGFGGLPPNLRKVRSLLVDLYNTSPGGKKAICDEMDKAATEMAERAVSGDDLEILCSKEAKEQEVFLRKQFGLVKMELNRELRHLNPDEAKLTELFAALEEMWLRFYQNNVCADGKVNKEKIMLLAKKIARRVCNNSTPLVESAVTFGLKNAQPLFKQN